MGLGGHKLLYLKHKPFPEYWGTKPWKQITGNRYLTPQRGESPRMGSPSEWNMHAKHAYACICIHLHEYMHLHIHMYICLHCICMQAYTRMACLHLHMLAWHASLMPCAPPPHTHRGGWHLPMGGAHPRYILWAPPLSTPHPTGGGSITITTPYPLKRGGEPLAPTKYIHL